MTDNGAGAESNNYLDVVYSDERKPKTNYPSVFANY